MPTLHKAPGPDNTEKSDNVLKSTANPEEGPAVTPRAGKPPRRCGREGRARGERQGGSSSPLWGTDGDGSAERILEQVGEPLFLLGRGPCLPTALPGRL